MKYVWLIVRFFTNVLIIYVIVVMHRNVSAIGLSSCSDSYRKKRCRVVARASCVKFTLRYVTLELLRD